MIKYLLEASACLIVFYAFYWLFLRNEKLLNINRFYLLITSLISTTLPLLYIKVNTGLVSSKSQKTYDLTMPVAEASSDSFLTIELFYLVGLVLATILFCSRLICVWQKLKLSTTFKKNGYQIFETEGNEAFSFLNIIFIGKQLASNDKLREHVLAHEHAHIKGRHAVDILCFEILRCIFWFNPVSYLYFKSIKLQHEYIADAAAMEATNLVDYKKLLLQFTLSKIDTALISSLKQHPIQKRLKMIYKSNSNIMNKLKPLFALPLLALLFALFSCSDTIEADIDHSLINDIETEIFIYEENPVYDSLSVKIDSDSEVEIVIEEIPEEESINLDSVIVKVKQKIQEVIEVVETPIEAAKKD